MERVSGVAALVVVVEGVTLRSSFRAGRNQEFRESISDVVTEGFCALLEPSERRSNDTKHVLRQDENGRGWPGLAVARVAPQCGIGASTTAEAGPGPSPRVNMFFVLLLCGSPRVSVSFFPGLCLCLCLSACVCVCVSLRLHHWQMVNHA